MQILKRHIKFAKRIPFVPLFAVLQSLFLTLMAFASVSAHGNEDYCPLKLENHIFNEIECGDEGCRFDINFPKTQGIKLASVELRYGVKENYIRSELEYKEFEKSYSSLINFSSEHSPFTVEAIYHQKACFSLLVLKVENRTVQDITNEI